MFPREVSGEQLYIMFFSAALCGVSMGFFFNSNNMKPAEIVPFADALAREAAVAALETLRDTDQSRPTAAAGVQ